MEFNNIENLDEMIWAYESFLQDVELKLKRGKSIKDLCSKLMRKEVFNIAHRATQEIKKSVMSSNDSQNETVKFYKKQAKRIEASFNQQISKYELNNELLIFWNFGISKIRLINFFFKVSILLTFIGLKVPKPIFKVISAN